MKNLIDQFDTRDTLVVISSYPEKGKTYGAKVGGIASFTKNTVSNIQKRPVIVLAEYFNKPAIYQEGNLLVIRCYKKNSPLMWVQLFSTLIQFKQAKKVLVHFDFALYGSILTSSLIVLFLTVVNLLGFSSSVVLHSVILNFSDIAGHIGISNSFLGRVKSIVLTRIFRIFYFLLGFISNKIITTDEILANNLGLLISPQKVFSIPHGVDTNLISIDKNIARKRLGIGKKDKVVLYFGFINWIKGADLFVKAYSKIDKLLGEKTRFIVAGGKSATLSQLPSYKDYYSKVLTGIKRSKSIKITGFVPQEKISLYFSACDIVIFPYRSFTFASGVLSLVFSYKKPFIVSSKIAHMMDSSDFKNALNESGLKKDDLIFDHNSKDLLVKTVKVLENGLKPKITKVSEIMRENRNWKIMAKGYEDIIFAPVYNLRIVKSVLAIITNKVYEQ